MVVKEKISSDDEPYLNISIHTDMATAVGMDLVVKLQPKTYR